MSPARPGGPAHQVKAEVLATARAGAYTSLTLLAPGVADGVRPGHFVALAVGGPDTSLLLRRAFSVYRARPSDAYGGTVEVVVAVHGRGTAWLVERRPHDVVDLVGPLGRPFSLPREPVTCVLVGGGYGSAPLFALAEGLRARGCAPHLVLGAATSGRLFAPPEARRVAESVTVTTEDGSAGARGLVTDVLAGLVERLGADVLYACGPMGMLAAVARVAADSGAHSQCAVEEAMACGIGVCMTCVLPVVGDDGRTRMTRACTDGPVFRGERVRWDAVGPRGSSVPPDCVGAPRMAGAVA